LPPELAEGCAGLGVGAEGRGAGAEGRGTDAGAGPAGTTASLFRPSQFFQITTIGAAT
jgi:hypothetical protein